MFSDGACESVEKGNVFTSIKSMGSEPDYRSEREEFGRHKIQQSFV